MFWQLKCKFLLLERRNQSCKHSIQYLSCNNYQQDKLDRPFYKLYLSPFDVRMHKHILRWQKSRWLLRKEIFINNIGKECCIQFRLNKYCKFHWSCWNLGCISICRLHSWRNYWQDMLCMFRLSNRNPNCRRIFDEQSRRIDSNRILHTDHHSFCWILICRHKIYRLNFGCQHI